MDNLESEIKALVSKIIKVPEDKISPDADLFKDLGIDSLLGVEIFASLDKKYGVNIPEKRLDKVKTLTDIIAVVAEYRSKK